MKLSIIGCGGRITGMLGMVREVATDLGHEVDELSVFDIDKESVVTRLAGLGIGEETIRFYDDPDAMLDTEKPDGVMIGTRCSLHASMAGKVLQRDLPLFLEKPVATTMPDLVGLKAAYEASSSTVVVSFPLRLTPLVALAKEIVDSGTIGTVEHLQAVNNVPYGGVYFHNWYRDENETQGLFLQKATHDFDYINYLLGIEPISICAVTSKRIFTGDKPAGLYCRDCAERTTCPEGPFRMKHRVYDAPTGDQCSFAVDTGNEDSGSALITYESGMHVSYSQNFFARKSAGKRGATLLGYKGTIEFDWYTDEVKVHMHHTPRTDTFKVDGSKMSHGGGDTVLAENFVEVVANGSPSVAPLEAGLQSVLMCLHAKTSAAEKRFVDISW